MTVEKSSIKEALYVTFITEITEVLWTWETHSASFGASSGHQ